MNWFLPLSSLSCSVRKGFSSAEVVFSSKSVGIRSDNKNLIGCPLLAVTKSNCNHGGAKIHPCGAESYQCGAMTHTQPKIIQNDHNKKTLKSYRLPL